MRSIEETRKKWDTLFSDAAIGLDLRQIVKEPEDFNPCEDGLRSICWKAFLLYGPPSQSSWPKKLSESRSAYSSLRDHFLRFIEHPDDLQSSIDPLADDNNSPWSSLRQDEVSRAEIFQDVERCLQDNFFFREPSTQKMLLDILFIYSKLHPDIGYRQGMHEVLAPVLWVVERDAIDRKEPRQDEKVDEGEQLMLQALDAQYVEHDAFTIFCAIMQTAKSFYEIGETNATSPIVTRSIRIHEELLTLIDPELADHLQAIEILPQIFLIRWIRLLYGREFAFNDVLSIWDLLFAENLNLSLIDMTCVAMLLRIRWQLMEADYSSALTLLLRYESPQGPFGPSTLVKDAIYLEQNTSTTGGATLIGRYSGRRPRLSSQGAMNPQRAPRPAKKAPQARYSLSNASEESLGGSSRSPARFQQYQKGLESAFQDVSGTLQKRAEGWSISKAVRGAVGEVRKNVSSIQSGANSPGRSADLFREPITSRSEPTDRLEELSSRVIYLENRNKALGKMLNDALEELRSPRSENEDEKQSFRDGSLNIALAKIQFVQVYLEDSEIPIPPPIPATPVSQPATQITKSGAAGSRKNSDESDEQIPPVSEPLNPVATSEKSPRTTPKKALVTGAAPALDHQVINAPMVGTNAGKLHPRPSLAQSTFSFMLGEDHHRSSFVSSVTIPPEERRGSDAKTRPKQLFTEGKTEEGKKGDKKGDKRGDESEDDGFTMSSLRGRRMS